jgi:crotonobetainyl-CoA:carnitine CoA-transferase CaiB-like acyl-CoA transferase
MATRCWIFTHFIAGPTATRLMAGMGAEVVKVELAPKGDQAREIQFIRDRRSPYFIQQKRGKQSLCLDMKNPATVELIKHLIPKFDVMVENFAPGIIGSMGLDYQTVSAINPSIINVLDFSAGTNGSSRKRSRVRLYRASLCRNYFADWRGGGSTLYADGRDRRR